MEESISLRRVAVQSMDASNQQETIRKSVLEESANLSRRQSMLELDKVNWTHERDALGSRVEALEAKMKSLQMQQGSVENAFLEDASEVVRQGWLLEQEQASLEAEREALRREGHADVGAGADEQRGHQST
mmetsp:Transcript_493/g.2144  ORF Transcript_493/g.2144 Transcript_493/m.2144 type:complete len:131 (+) Transcript_493:724-1116(+)